MCGIAGQFLRAPVVPSEAELRAAGAVMRYRGPDDEGIHVAPHIGLVHRRLSIRDLSPAGRCPMASADGRVQVLLNGEIYNWRELRDDLATRGHRFASTSDTEVVLAGFQQWGISVIPRLRGMFAIAIWDGNDESLLLARDRVGEKPLFYRDTGERLDFASSVAALALLNSDNTIDAAAVTCYFAHGFIPSTHAIWEGVSVLPPGSLLKVSPGSATTVERWWQLPRARPVRRPAADCLGTMEQTIEDSVVRCLDADVPVGVFLSGGVDSSLVAAMAARHRPGLPAFSVGFREQAFNELPFARSVARHAGLEHDVVEIGVEDVIECLPHLVRQYGQPFGDASAVPSHLLAKLARHKVTVCLSGDGGDEAFGGYWRLQAGVYSDRYARLVPAVLRRGLVPQVAPLLGAVGRRWLAMNELSLAPVGASYTNAESWFGQLAALAGPRLRPGLAHDLIACRTAGSGDLAEASIVQRILYEDFQVQLPDDFLAKVDVASMAASLEVRAPLLDQKVIEEAWLLPDAMKLRWGERKWLLKAIAARWVPREVVYRPKMGFALPLVEWWRRELGDWLAGLLDDSVAAEEGWIDAGIVRAALDRHRRGEDHHTRLWLVLWFELWLRSLQGADEGRAS
jgi:asparagine synthase (glutamine-hydrolysing)